MNEKVLVYKYNTNGKLSTPEQIILPDGQEVNFDPKSGTIQMDVCKPYVGKQIQVIRDGNDLGYFTLNKVDKNEDGVTFISFDKGTSL